MPSSSMKRTKRASSIPWLSLGAIGTRTRCRQGGPGREGHLVVGGGDPSDPVDRVGRPAAGDELVVQRSQRDVEVGVREPVGKLVEHERGAQAVVLEGSQHPVEQIAVVARRAPATADQVGRRARRSGRRHRRRRRRCGTRSQEWCPSPMARRLITNRVSPSPRPRLVWMGHHRGVADGGTLDGVLLREVGADQLPARPSTARRGARSGGRRARSARRAWRPDRRGDRRRRRRPRPARRPPRRRRVRARARRRSPARDSTSTTFSWPGTNSLASTRPGSGRSRWAVRRTSIDAVASSREHELVSVLERGDHRQGRFGTLVLVSTVDVEAVTATPGRRVVERCAGIVVAEEPTDGSLDALRPTGVTGQPEGAGTGIGERRHLDRLLVEARTGLAERPSAHGRDRQMGIRWSRRRAASRARRGRRRAPERRRDARRRR